ILIRSAKRGSDLPPGAGVWATSRPPRRGSFSAGGAQSDISSVGCLAWPATLGIPRKERYFSAELRRWCRPLGRLGGRCFERGVCCQSQPAVERHDKLATMDRQVLKGQAILLVEEQLNGRDLIAAPQRAGAAVWLAPHAAEALVCLDQFDFSWLVW